MSTVDGRIDCPMVGCLTTDEYYVALDKLGKCSKLSGRVTTVLESDAVEKATEGSEGRPIGHEAFHVAEKADEYTIAVDTYGKIQWKKNEADGHPLLSICRKMYRKNISKRLPTRAFLGLPPAKDVSICAVQLRYYTNNSVLNVWQWSAAVISAAVSPKRD